MQKRVYENNGELYKLPNLYGFVEDTEVYFTNEKIYLIVENNGNVVFSDETGKQLAQTVVLPETKNNKHDNAYCRVLDGKILVFLPIVAYEDNYPYCDGEYDRWSVVDIGYNCIAFDLADGTLETSEVKSLE